MNRAAEQLNSLNKQVIDFVALKPYKLIPQYDVNERIKSYKIRETNVPPLELRAPIGEFAVTLRTALDHLMYALSSLKTSDPGNEIEFPIFDVLQGGAIRKRIRYLSPEARKLVRDVQPYQRGDIKAAHEDFLWVLHRLCNIQKHKVSPVVANGFALSLPFGGSSLFITGVNHGQELPLGEIPVESDGQPGFKIEPALAVRIKEPDFEDLVPLWPTNSLITLYEYVRDKVYLPIEGTF